ncbi:hypothetical protein KOW79_014671 [Hemibagrus wyckioides]|uniref:Uncharacterized protein n=1 Tax=Hemibagrus wyckioides TaxID=337641 RepID=A0A9D3SJJ4_9TELE|nr:hypothetical protein KOW79_014671 [Hemibagrus wyckioides]
MSLLVTVPFWGYRYVIAICEGLAAFPLPFYFFLTICKRGQSSPPERQDSHSWGRVPPEGILKSFCARGMSVI